MTVPLVAEFCASTSTYGRLAPLPPVAVAAALTVLAALAVLAVGAVLAAGMVLAAAVTVVAALVAAEAGWAATANTLPYVRTAAVPANARMRLGWRMEWNT